MLSTISGPSRQNVIGCHKTRARFSTPPCQEPVAALFFALALPRHLRLTPAGVCARPSTERRKFLHEGNCGSVARILP